MVFILLSQIHQSEKIILLVQVKKRNKENYMSDLISVIITTYNRANLIGETLDSIISQSYTNWECIVVDDHSSDFTKELMEFYLKKDTRIKYFSRPAELNKGATSCRNYGFQISKGNFINWFDSDDIMAVSYLEKQLNKILYQESDLSVSNFSVFTSTPEEFFFTINNLSTSENFLLDYITGKINPGIQCALWRRKAVTGWAFEENLVWAQEVDFFFKICKNNNLNVSFLEENLIFLRRHSDSMTGNYQKFALGEISSELKVRREILKFLYLSEHDTDYLRKALKIYFNAFKLLLVYHKWSLISMEVKKLKKVFGMKHGKTVWEIKLIILILLQKMKIPGVSLQKHFDNFNRVIIKFSD